MKFYWDYPVRDKSYMQRWGIRIDRLCSVMLHKINGPDLDDKPHGHPWTWRWTFVLWGGYRETLGQFENKERVLVAPETNFCRGQSIHRISRVIAPTWTLTVTGPRVSNWGFWKGVKFTPKEKTVD